MQVIDRLPAGARFRAGSLRLNGVRIADPVVAADGTQLHLPAPDCSPPASRITLRYVVEFTVAMRGMKDAINTAQAFAPGNVRSNEARALVRMNEELFSQKGFIVGRVFEGTCDVTTAARTPASPNVRVYLEDGRYGVTDENGHFHFEGLEPGTHTVQLDKLTLPEYLELAPCADRMGHAGRDYSQFAELRAGTLWRSDFVLRQKARAARATCNSNSIRRCSPDPDDDGLAAHEAVVRVNGVPAGNTRVMVMLPDGFEYVPGSATVDGDRGHRLRRPDGRRRRAGRQRRRRRRHARLGELRAGHGAHGALRDACDASARAARCRCARSRCSIRRRSRACARSRSSRSCRAARRAIGRSQFTFTPRFDVLKTELSPADEDALHYLINSWRGARDITIRAVGHADSQPISGRNRKVFADNYALSQARAQTVADYLAISLNVPEARVHVEGRGSDEPVNHGQGCREPRRQSPRRDRHRRRALRSERAARTRDGRRRAAEDSPRGRDAARSGHRRERARRATTPMVDKLGMGVVIDVEALKPGIALAGAAGRCHAAPISVDQDRDPARAGPDRGAHA